MQGMRREEKMDFALWAIRLCWEQSILGRVDADRNDHLTLCFISPWKGGPHIAQKKREKGEIQIIADVSSKNVRSLIVARCCSREWEGKSVLFSLKVAKGGRLSHQLQLNGKINYFSRNCGIMRRNAWILVVQSCWRTQCSWLELIKQILTELSRNPEMKIDSFKLEG